MGVVVRKRSRTVFTAFSNKKATCFENFEKF